MIFGGTFVNRHADDECPSLNLRFDRCLRRQYTAFDISADQAFIYKANAETRIMPIA
ncbi:hypothetical protein K788_00010200 (plasmid) [Paraburkholderia caribensis MBA4]|uniref:Uncharacterized protein n=1 Tax=Paraburkholderia caribensis MBA4 TaxID=1323664 RepID=A0A0P0RQL7_9BURK|nr:hypothetical protein K788_00010200 [Paraburkholderia caribensis MBA4]